MRRHKQKHFGRFKEGFEPTIKSKCLRNTSTEVKVLFYTNTHKYGQ